MWHARTINRILLPNDNGGFFTKILLWKSVERECNITHSNHSLHISLSIYISPSRLLTPYISPVLYLPRSISIYTSLNLAHYHIPPSLARILLIITHPTQIPSSLSYLHNITLHFLSLSSFLSTYLSLYLTSSSRYSIYYQFIHFFAPYFITISHI